MPIMSSEIISQLAQADGRTAVTERHTDHAGKTYDIEYLAAGGLDIMQVMNERAARMGAEIDATEAALAEAANFVLPITRYQYLERFTTDEYAAITALAATDAEVAFILKKLDAAEEVYVGLPAVQDGLAYLVSVGALTAERAAVIGAV